MKLFWYAVIMFAAILPSQGSMVVTTTDTQNGVVVAGQPGVYSVYHGEAQQVVATYVLTTVPPENASNLCALFTKLLGNDGRTNGAVQVATQLRDGHPVVLMTIVATPEMQKTIGQTVELFNQGKLDPFSQAIDTIRYRPAYVRASDLAAVLSKEISSIGYVYYDSATNIVSVIDETPLLGWLRQVIETYDVKPGNLAVEIQVIETAKGIGSNLGVYWDAWKNVLPAGASLAVSGVGSPSTRVTSFEALFEQANPQAISQFLNYLEDQKVAKVEARTVLNIVNGRPTTFRSGSDIPYQVLRGGAVKETTDETAFAGLSVSIDPFLAAKLAKLTVTARSSSIIGYAQNGAPTMAESSVSTTVNIDGPKVFSLSGLNTKRHVEERRGIPLIGRLPLIGSLFSWTTKDIHDYDMTIVVRVANFPTNK